MTPQCGPPPARCGRPQTYTNNGIRHSHTVPPGRYSAGTYSRRLFQIFSNRLFRLIGVHGRLHGNSLFLRSAP
jgi:hypothetical protein